MAGKHPGFAAVQQKIAGKAGVGKKAAASPAAKKAADPKLKRVKPAKNQPRSQAHGIMKQMLDTDQDDQ